MKTCPFCKEDIHSDATRCRFCAGALTETQNGDRITYVFDRGLVRFAKFAAAILGIFFIFGAYAFGFKIEVALERAHKLQDEMKELTPDLEVAKQELAAERSRLNASRTEALQVARDLQLLKQDAVSNATTMKQLAPDLQAARIDLASGRSELTASRLAAQRLSSELDALKAEAASKTASIAEFYVSAQRHLTPAQEQVAVTAQATAALPAQLPKLWPKGSTLTVGFLDGTDKVIERVKPYLQRWIDQTSLHLEYVAASKAKIRVSFTQAGSWSFVGTDALAVPPDQPTINFGWLRPDSAEAEVRRVVLHEFGHTLGLVEEMNNPNADIPWNRTAVIADLSAPPNSWPTSLIEERIFKRYKQSELPDYRSFDPDSVMMFPISGSWTNDKLKVGLNADLSDSDRAFISRLYP